MDPEGLRLFDTHEVPFVVAGTTRELGYARLPHAWAGTAADVAARGGTGALTPVMARPARELVCLWEFWLLPIAVALLPYRAGLALARWCARTLPLYDETARAGQAQYRAARPRGDARRWLVDFRFTQLIDHADLFWALTRRERFLLSHLDARAARSAPGPLVVISMHYGQGLWLLPWLRAAGVPARFLSVRFDAASFDSRLQLPLRAAAHAHGRATVRGAGRSTPAVRAAKSPPRCGTAAPCTG